MDPQPGAVPPIPGRRVVHCRPLSLRLCIDDGALGRGHAPLPVGLGERQLLLRRRLCRPRLADRQLVRTLPRLCIDDGALGRGHAPLPVGLGERQLLLRRRLCRPGLADRQLVRTLPRLCEGFASLRELVSGVVLLPDGCRQPVFGSLELILGGPHALLGRLHRLPGGLEPEQVLVTDPVRFIARRGIPRLDGHLRCRRP